MKSYKKNLQIQTSFDHQQQEQHHIAITNQDFILEQKIQSANLITQILNFIFYNHYSQSFKWFKQAIFKSKSFQKHSRTQKNVSILGSERYRENIEYIDEEKRRKNHRVRPKSLASKQQRTERSRQISQSHHLKRNRSYRAINHDIQCSRANVLEEIVQKLQNNKRHAYDNFEEDNSNQQVIKRITRLQRMVRGIRSQTQNRNNIIRSSKGNILQNHGPYEDNQPSQNHQILSQFLKEIKIIKRQVREIKANNEIILRSEQQRSRLSLDSQKNEKLSERQKVFLNEGVQTVQKTDQRFEKASEAQQFQKSKSPITTLNSNQVTRTTINNNKIGPLNPPFIIPSNSETILQVRPKSHSQLNSSHQSRTIYHIREQNNFNGSNMNMGNINSRDNNWNVRRVENPRDQIQPFSNQVKSVSIGTKQGHTNQNHLAYPIPTVPIAPYPNYINFPNPNQINKFVPFTYEYRNANSKPIAFLPNQIQQRITNHPQIIHYQNRNVHFNKKQAGEYCSLCHRSCSCPRVHIQSTMNR